MATNFKPCLIDTCNGDARHSAHGARGYCARHYYRLRMHGEPLGGGTSNGEPLRFINDVIMLTDSDECIIWPFATSGVGYAAFWLEGRQVRVTRYVCELTHGRAPSPEHEAAHSCGNGHEGCVNRHHLSWKTPQQNAMDKVFHGTHLRGERSHFAKLTEAQAKEILSLKGLRLQSEIAAEFGVSKSTVGMIHCGKTWHWLAR